MSNTAFEAKVVQENGNIVVTSRIGDSSKVVVIPSQLQGFELESFIVDIMNGVLEVTVKNNEGMRYQFFVDPLLNWWAVAVRDALIGCKFSFT